MRRWAFVITLIGIFVLFTFLNFGEKNISSKEELQSYEVNSRVVVSGFVESQRIISGGRKLLALENEIVLVCDCEEDFSDGNFVFLGVVYEFDGEKEIEVLKAKNVS